jgi:hypothetical protein
MEALKTQQKEIAGDTVRLVLDVQTKVGIQSAMDVAVDLTPEGLLKFIQRISATAEMAS